METTTELVGAQTQFLPQTGRRQLQALDSMEATGLTMAERLTSSCHQTRARSSQEASHVLRRTRCASKYVTVAVLDRLGTIVLETTVSTREPERLLAVLPVPPPRGGSRDLPLLALALRLARAGGDRLPPRPRQAAPGHRHRPAEK